jgi:Zn-dependent protease with chaperone function
MANDPRYAFWCEACGWNLIRPDDRRRLGPIDRFLAWLGQRQGSRLADDAIRHGAARPSFDVAILVAVLVALVVYAFTAGVAWLGVVSVTSGGGLYGFVYGAICLGLVVVLRPRVPMVSGTVHGRAELPHLFALVDRVAAGIGTAPIDGIELTPEINAGFGRAGWRRRRILQLGVPLFLALDPAERVALLGHELGHSVNGDAGRLLILGSAHDTLISLWTLVEPDSMLPSVREGLTGYLIIPFRVVQLGIARAILGLALLQLVLCYRTSQRAEFHADAIASRLAGTRGTAALIARLHGARPAAELAWSTRPADPARQIADRLRRMPDREIERLRRIDAIEGARIDATHPPTVDRERVIAGLPAQVGSVVLTAGESDAIDRELDPFLPALSAELAEQAALAYG